MVNIIVRKIRLCVCDPTTKELFKQSISVLQFVDHRHILTSNPKPLKSFANEYHFWWFSAVI
jgi:hypothetical protein